MKHLTLYTVQHEQMLQSVAAKWTLHDKVIIEKGRWLRNNHVFGMRTRWACSLTDMAEEVMALLAAVAMQANPVYRQAPKLRQMAQALQSTHLYIEHVDKLKIYLRANKSLHMEGYVMFCMEDYRRRLDMMSYSVIKKIRARGHLQ